MRGTSSGGSERPGMYHGRRGEPARAPVVGRPEALAARPDLADIWERADAAFPVRVTRSFWERIAPGEVDDPLARQVLPDPRELEDDPGDLDDPVGDAAR